MTPGLRTRTALVTLASPLDDRVEDLWWHLQLVLVLRLVERLEDHCPCDRSAIPGLRSGTSGSKIVLTTVGCSRNPPLAIVEYALANCNGVAAIRP